MDEHFLFSYPGIQQILHGSFTLGAGTTPSIATLEMAPQPGFIPVVGPLTLTRNGTPVITFPDCRPTEAVLRRGRDGFVWSVSIQDRRWKWAFGYLNGHYNRRIKQGGFIKASTKKTPKELAELCFTAMGETNYDHSLMPNENYPEVAWDVVTPATALQDLLEKVGCRIVLGTNNVAKIWPVGDGANLPTGNEMNASYTFNPPEKPDELIFVGAPIKFQCKFTTEAVGRDTDGTIKLINDLSYKPATGWRPPQFPTVVDVDARKLAQATVFRWYRVKKMLGSAPPSGTGTTITETLDIPGFISMDNIDQLVLLDETTEHATDPQTGEEKTKPPFLIGLWNNGELYQQASDSSKKHLPGLRIIPETNMFELADPAWRLKDGVLVEAFLLLETAFHVLDYSTRMPIRYTFTRSLGGTLGTRPRVIKHDEIQFTKRVTYATSPGIGVVDNDTPDHVSHFAKKYLDGAEAEYQTATPLDITFAGILDIPLDGRITQTTWTVARDGATTRASMGTEHSVVVPDYAARVKAAKIEKLIETAKASPFVGRPAAVHNSIDVRWSGYSGPRGTPVK